ncbi:MAG: hypothetical protein M4579_006636 [Chaenotheca gracillima]|nr:MAG: hypothetical protein M4579_006636 [Chaenotheca gracillima]
MPMAKAKPADIAGEAKKTYIPYVDKMMPQWAARSYLYSDPADLKVNNNSRFNRLRVAVIDGDPLDVALDWYEANLNSASSLSYGSTTIDCPRIPVVNMANEKRPGGDWESGLMAPEECLCRRTNLVQALTRPMDPYATYAHYPIPQMGGIYSPSVDTAVVYRSGPDRYQVWSEFKVLPVISVAPVRRPKLDESGTRYSFEQEKELMKEKMRVILRIAIKHGHRNLCLGAFGVGNGFRNPVSEVAVMWREILFNEPEFQGLLDNIVFAIESNPPGQGNDGASNLQVFQNEFDPSTIFGTPYAPM